MHDHNEPGSRGGFSLYVPEYYTPDRAWPLVMALHGGSGNGRNFLWSWLRDARSFGAILVAPTATGPTWALMGDDTDTPNLSRILEAVRARWNIDRKRMLLTGMSDGGTFCYVSGLDSASPFTHLAPVASTFHPLMAEMADAERLRGLPIFLVHGRLDWMFPVQVARQTAQALSAAGANVDLSRDRRFQPHLSARDQRGDCCDGWMTRERFILIPRAASAGQREPKPARSRYQAVTGGIRHADFSGNDLGCAASGLRGLYLQLDADVDRRQWPGRDGQSHHRELGRCIGRLE